MPSPRGHPASSDREWFLRQFEGELRFYQLFFLLVNRSCPIKKIDLVWAETGPARRVGLHRLMGTAEALKDSGFRILHDTDALPDPSFCNIVNDFGRRFSESCALSDKAAEKRVRRTGQPQVYQCHAGLIDIAVPVMYGEQHIATLLTGQVLREAPTEDQFDRIRESLGGLGYIDWERLEEAYRAVPVVSQVDLDATVEILQVFAENLATSWKRVADAMDREKQKAHELNLDRKELGHLLLEGHASDRSSVHELMSRIGLTHAPNRVLIVRLGSEDDYTAGRVPYDVAFASAIHAVEQVCFRVKNAFCVHLRRRGVCVFLHDQGDGGDVRSELKAQSVAQRIVNAVRSRCDLPVQIGIGDAKPHWEDTMESYQEARLALATAGRRPVTTFTEPPQWTRELSEVVDAICLCLAERRFGEAEVKLSSLPLELSKHFGREPRSSGHRFFYASVLDSMLLTAERLGCSSQTLTDLRARFLSELEQEDSLFRPDEAFQEAGEQLLVEVRGLYIGRHRRIVQRARQSIERQLRTPFTARSISLPAVAAEIGVSSGHLSRTFRRLTGRTLERYLMERRVEVARRLLLEPMNSVTEVADICGFSDPTYFARVFRKILGCSPSEYAKDPTRVACGNGSSGWGALLGAGFTDAGEKLPDPEKPELELEAVGR
jgi:AraC-like DNA-binding protein/ligand-binding sensor protein